MNNRKIYLGNGLRFIPLPSQIFGEYKIEVHALETALL